MTEGQTGFKKEIRLFDAVMLVAGNMIGSGIFIVSANIAQSVGSAGWLLFVWGLAGLITLIAAVSYGELTSMMPKAGGQYIFLKEAYSPLLAFLYGWTLFLVIQTGTIAAVGVAFAKFSGVFFPWFNDKNALLTLGNLKITSQQLLAVSVIALLTFMNILGVKNGKMIQNIFGSTKILALVGLIILGLFFTNASAIHSNFSTPWEASDLMGPISGWSIIVAVGVAMVGALFSSDAWNNISFAGDEIVNPKKTIALSLAIGTGLVTVIYILANVIYLLVLPIKGDPAGLDAMSRGIQFATNERVAVAVAEVVGGNTATFLISLLIVISTFSCLNGLILAGARVYYKIAEDGLFFKPVARLNKNGVPQSALILQGIWASLLCLSGSYSDLLDYVIFAVLIFYILTIAGIFILRKKWPDVPRPYKAFGYPFLPGLYIFLASAICVILFIYKPNYTWPGLLIVALGLPAYLVFKKINTTKHPD